MLPLKRRRIFWNKLHLWLGLVLGLPLALIGLSGSVLVFWQEIDAILNPALFQVSAQVSATENLHYSLGHAVAAAINAAPSGWDALWISIPSDHYASLPFHFYYPSPQSSIVGAESLNVFVNPYDGSVLGSRVFYHDWNPLKHCFIGFIFKLHYAFFLGDTGVVMVGVMAVLLMMTMLAGLILWWPLDHKWKRALTFKKNASSVRFNHDLHQLAGFYPLLVMFALLISGMYFNLPEQFKWIVGQFSPLSGEPEVPTASSPAMWSGLDRALNGLPEALRGGRLDSITIQDPASGSLVACYRDVPNLASHMLDTRCLWLGLAGGEVLQVQDAQHGSAGDHFMLWQWPLHSGQAFGITGRLLVFVAGLLCPVLFVTGVIRWLQKHRARAKSVMLKRARQRRLTIPPAH